MQTALAIAVMLAVEIGILLWAAHSPGPHALRGRVVCFNMILIGIFGSTMLTFGGYQTNVANLFYAVVAAGQCVILECYGAAAARATIPMVNRTLAPLFAVLAALILFPMVDGNEAVHAAVRLLVTHTPDLMAASLVCFGLSQMVLIRSWQQLRRLHGPLPTAALATLACQAVDSPTFFLIAFWRTQDLAWIFEAAAVGFLFKGGLAVALLPALALALWWARASRPHSSIVNASVSA